MATPQSQLSNGWNLSTTPPNHRFSSLGSFLILANQDHLIEKLPPPTRAAVLMTLLGILLLGMFLVVIVLLGGSWVRKVGKHRRGPSVPPDVTPIPTCSPRVSANRPTTSAATQFSPPSNYIHGTAPSNLETRIPDETKNH